MLRTHIPYTPNILLGERKGECILLITLYIIVYYHACVTLLLNYEITKHYYEDEFELRSTQLCVRC